MIVSLFGQMYVDILLQSTCKYEFLKKLKDKFYLKYRISPFYNFEPISHGYDLSKYKVRSRVNTLV